MLPAPLVPMVAVLVLVVFGVDAYVLGRPDIAPLVARLFLIPLALALALNVATRVTIAVLARRRLGSEVRAWAR